MTTMTESRTFPAGRLKALRAILGLAAAGVLGAGAIVLMTTGSDAPTSSPASPQINSFATAQAASAGPVLYKLDTGEPVPFSNGETLKVGDLDVSIYVSPYPPPRAANIDFGVERNGLPLEDAYVTLQYDMTTMAHGPFKLLAIPAGTGHYVVPVEFEMEGDFYLNVAVDDGSTESVLQLGVRAKR